MGAGLFVTGCSFERSQMSRFLLIGDFSGGSAHYIAILSPPSSGEQNGNKTIEKM